MRRIRQEWKRRTGRFNFKTSTKMNMNNHCAKNGPIRLKFIILTAIVGVIALGLLYFQNRTVRIALPVGAIRLNSGTIAGSAVSLATNLNASGTALLKRGRFQLGEAGGAFIIEVPADTKAVFDIHVSLNSSSQSNQVTLRPASDTKVTFTPAITISKGSLRLATLESLTLAGSGDAAMSQCRLDLIRAFAHLIIAKITGPEDSQAGKVNSDLRLVVSQINVQAGRIFIREGAILRVSEQTLVTGAGGCVRLSRVKWESDRRFSGDAEVKLLLAKGTLLNAGKISLSPDRAELFLKGRFERLRNFDKLTIQKAQSSTVALSVFGGCLRRKDGASTSITKLQVDDVHGEWTKSTTQAESLRLKGSSSVTVELAAITMRGVLSFAEGKLTADGMITVPMARIQSAVRACASSIVGYRASDFEIRSFDAVCPNSSTGELKLRARIADDSPALLKITMCSAPLAFHVTGALDTREDGRPTASADFAIPALEAELDADKRRASLTATTTLSSAQEIWFYEWTKNQQVFPGGPFWDEQVLHMRLRVKTHPFSVSAVLEVEAYLDGEDLVIQIKSIKSKGNDQAITGFVDTHDMFGFGANWQFKPFDVDRGTVSAKVVRFVNRDFDIGNPIRGIIDRAVGMKIKLALPKN